MATTTTITSNYAGAVAGGYFTKAFKEASFLKNGAFTIYENVNDDISLRKLEMTSGRRDYSCGFVPAGSITLSEVKLTPVKKKDDFEICKESFRKEWGSESWGASAHNSTWNKELMDKIADLKLQELAEFIGGEVWDIFETKALADSTVIKIDAAATIDKTTVEAELEKVLAAAPKAILKTAKLSVSADIAQAYNFLLISKGIANGLGGNANTPMVYGMTELVVDYDLPAKTMVLADPKNLAFATGSLSDYNELKLVDQDDTLLNGKIAGTLVYNYDAGYVYGAEVVFYSPNVA